MSALSPILRRARGSDGDVLGVWCPGCDDPHMIPVQGPRAWQWDGNVEAPTFSPSLLVRGGERVCHSHVRAGRFEFLSDCTHALAGQTVPIAPWPADFDDGDRE